MSKSIKITVTKTELTPLNEYLRYLQKIWKANWVTNNGQMLLELERRLQKLYNTKNLLVVSNGTLAIQLALKALPQRSGEVITTPFTFQATTNTVIWEGFTPVFADIDPNTYNLDPVEVEKKITSKTVAILAVHVYGNACEVEKLQKLGKKYNIAIIYDSAHAFDVIYRGRQLAGYGDISILSFHATKTFHTIEGGAILCKDPKVFEQLKLLRNFGIKSEEEVISCGINAKMNELQAAMGLANLKWMKRRYVLRKKVHDLYIKRLKGNKHVTLQKITVDRENYTYLPILLESKKIRDYVYNSMKMSGIGTRKYFYPLTISAEFLQKNQKKSLLKTIPIAVNISDRVLCLPMYASLASHDVIRITNLLDKLLKMKQKKV